MRRPWPGHGGAVVGDVAELLAEILADVDRPAARTSRCRSSSSRPAAARRGRAPLSRAAARSQLDAVAARSRGCPGPQFGQRFSPSVERRVRALAVAARSRRCAPERSISVARMPMRRATIRRRSWVVWSMTSPRRLERGPRAALAACVSVRRPDRARARTIAPARPRPAATHGPGDRRLPPSPPEPDLPPDRGPARCSATRSASSPTSGSPRAPPRSTGRPSSRGTSRSSWRATTSSACRSRRSTAASAATC